MERKGIQPTLVPLVSLPAGIHKIPAEQQVSRNWKALSQLLANPWFERVWVMQEAIMACSETSNASNEKDQILLSFEKSTIDYYFLSVVIKVLASDHLLSNIRYDDRVQDGQSNLGRWSPHGVTAIDTFRLHRELRGRNRAVGLNQAVRSAWSFKASDDRDKIYAVLGFAGQALHDFRPNYEATVEETYISWAASILTRDNDLPELLHLAGIGHERSHDTLPSWVSDLSVRSYTAGLVPPITQAIRGQHYLASGKIEPTGIKIDMSSLTLRFQGIKIDTIDSFYNESFYHESLSGKSGRWYEKLISSHLSSFTSDKKLFRSELQWLDDIEGFLNDSKPGTPKPKQSNPQRREILWQTLTGDYPSGRSQMDSHLLQAFGDLAQAFECWYESVRILAGKDMIGRFRGIIKNRKTEFYDRVGTFEDAISGSLRDRPVFGTTEKRLLGHGPKGLLPGDVLCVVRGAFTPFLVRKAVRNDGSSGTRWHLVGDCFVHSLMYGEGLSMGEYEEFVVE